MLRNTVVVGDSPMPGGKVLPYGGPSFTILGHQAALIGGRAYCEGCHSIGVIAKAGGPRRQILHGAEVALEGDVVLCQCATPQPLVSALQSSFHCDDGAADSAGAMLTLAVLQAGGLAVHSGSEVAHKKAVDENFSHAAEHEPTEAICPNMTNRQFTEQVLKLRDIAVDIISKERLPELERWDRAAQDRMRMWFGQATPEVRDYLRKGTTACERVLRGLVAQNFVRYSEANSQYVGCTFPNPPPSGTAASVCKPDTTTRTIAIAHRFCELPENKQLFGTQTILLGDTKLLTIVHEVSHFIDTFNSRDTWYSCKHSLEQVANRTNHRALLLNADSLAGYMLGVED